MIDVGRAPVHLVQRLHAVARLGHGVALALQQVLHHPAKLVLVVHQQHAAPLPGRRRDRRRSA